MMKKKAVILDVDGTLWDSTGVVADAWNEAVKVLGIDCAPLTAQGLEKVFGKTMTAICEEVFGISDSERQQKVMEVCYELEHHYIVDNLEDIFYPCVQDTIPQLAEKFDLYIVSNCQSGYIEVMLSKSTFSAYIRDFECFGNTGKSKGENIRILMERNDIEDAWYVGDTMGDYEASKEAGLPFVFASYGFGEVENPDKIIANFKDLLQL